MELIMKLITRLVEALEKSAANSDVIVKQQTELLEIQRRQLAIGEAHLAIQQSYASVELVSGAAEGVIHPAELDPTDSRDGKPAINDGDAKQHVSQAALDAAAAASAAEQKAKQAKAEQEAAQAAVEAKRKADLAEAQAKQQAADAAKSEAKKKVTVDDVRAALRKYATAHGNEAAMGILQKHEAVSVSAIDPAKYEDVLKDLA